MLITATVGGYVGLGLLMLMALAPLLVELDQRFPVADRAEDPERECAVPARGARC